MCFDHTDCKVTLLQDYTHLGNKLNNPLCEIVFAVQVQLFIHVSASRTFRVEKGILASFGDATETTATVEIRVTRRCWDTNDESPLSDIYARKYTTNGIVIVYSQK